jgi:hypothetical protein
LVALVGLLASVAGVGAFSVLPHPAASASNPLKVKLITITFFIRFFLSSPS